MNVFLDWKLFLDASFTDGKNGNHYSRITFVQSEVVEAIESCQLEKWSNQQGEAITFMSALKNARHHNICPVISFVPEIRIVGINFMCCDIIFISW